jgi:hypothetical protein
MHRGRPYPFHPTYWATEAWFWRGHCPWKMTVHFNGFTDEPWSFIPPGFDGLSDAGRHPLNPTEISYDFLVVDGTPPLTLTVTLDRIGSHPNYRARWRAFLRADYAWDYSVAFGVQQYPQRIISIDQFDYSVPVLPYTSTAGPPLILRPADYATGGSPWD